MIMEDMSVSAVTVGSVSRNDRVLVLRRLETAALQIAALLAAAQAIQSG